jgi:hypothetical protein
LPLLTYPDSGTRGLVRMILGRMHSHEAIGAMKADLDAAVERGEWPDGGVVAGLIAAEEDPMPRLVRLVMTHPEIEAYDYLPCAEFRSYFVESLLNENDPAQASAEARIIRRACRDEEESILSDVLKRHASSAVRQAISKTARR